MTKPPETGLKGGTILLIIILGVVSVSWLAVRFSGAHLGTPWNALFPGAAIVCAAFMLSWCTELAEMDLPRSVAVILLALVAVLPEYAVDIYFAWQAGKDPQYVPYTLANMSGGNQLLIGLGWSSVVIFFCLKTRSRAVKVEKGYRLEMFFLLAATLYSFILPLKRTLSLWDSAVFIAMFAVYVRMAMKAEHEEPELMGPAAFFARFPVGWRRFFTYGGFAYAAFVIFYSAEPFAEGLLEMGRHAGIDEFILVQWLAPLASESPEFIVALLFAAHGKPQLGLGALISSKINQWTLLVGMLPIAYSASIGAPSALHLDHRQMAELTVTSAQSFFAMTILADLSFGLWEAVLVAAIFLSHLPFTSETSRYIYAGAYLLFSINLLIAKPENRLGISAMWKHARDTWRLK